MMGGTDRSLPSGDERAAIAAAIASDLHDETGPHLFATRAALTQAEAAAQRVGGPGLAQLLDALAAIARHTAAVQRSTRHALGELRPLLNAGSGLDGSLSDLVATLADIAPDTRVVLSVDPDIGAADPHGQAVYRFIRESALNALRHGLAGHIRISVKRTGAGGIVARVSDNGRGPQPGATPGMGHAGIQDRARALGGTWLPPVHSEGWTMTEFRTAPT